MRAGDRRVKWGDRADCRPAVVHGQEFLPGDESPLSAPRLNAYRLETRAHHCSQASSCRGQGGIPHHPLWPSALSKGCPGGPLLIHYCPAAPSHPNSLSNSNEGLLGKHWGTAQPLDGAPGPRRPPQMRCDSCLCRQPGPTPHVHQVPCA